MRTIGCTLDTAVGLSSVLLVGGYAGRLTGIFGVTFGPHAGIMRHVTQVIAARIDFVTAVFIMKVTECE